MIVKIEMTTEVPTDHGIYYVVNRKGEPNLRQCRVGQGPRDYFPRYQVDGTDYTAAHAKELFYFSRESVTFQVLLEQGSFVRSLM